MCWLFFFSLIRLRWLSEAAECDTHHCVRICELHCAMFNHKPNGKMCACVCGIWKCNLCFVHLCCVWCAHGNKNTIHICGLFTNSSWFRYLFQRLIDANISTLRVNDLYKFAIRVPDGQKYTLEIKNYQKKIIYDTLGWFDSRIRIDISLQTNW